MSADNDRIVILPRDVSNRVMSIAVSRAASTVAIAAIICSIPVVVDVFLVRGLGDQLVVPVLCLVAMATLIALCALGRRTIWVVLYLLCGSAIAVVYTIAVLGADPSLNDDGQFLANRVSFALVLAGGSISRPRRGMVWVSVGFVCATLVCLASARYLGLDFAPGLAAIVAWVVSLAGYTTLALEERSRSLVVPDLARLEEETRRLAIESQFEQRAAAIVHDTVLGDLAAVMSSVDRIDDRMRARLRADIATLSDPSWLRGNPDDDDDNTTVDGALRNAIVSLAHEFQWRGLTVNSTGDYESATWVAAEAATALVAALRACLENIATHAKTDSADLVFGTGTDQLTAMVIDSGIGFDPAAVAPDRLGIRASIVGRIEEHGGTVRVWSQPGVGTSVLIALPAPRPAGRATTQPSGGATSDVS